MRVTDALLAIAGLFILWSLIRAHRNPAIDINLFDLVTENGKLGRVAVGYMVTLVVTSWVLIRAALDGKMTDAEYLGYGALWVTPLVAKILSAQSTTTTTSSSSSSSTEEVMKGRT